MNSAREAAKRRCYYAFSAWLWRLLTPPLLAPRHSSNGRRVFEACRILDTRLHFTMLCNAVFLGLQFATLACDGLSARFGFFLRMVLQRLAQGSGFWQACLLVQARLSFFLSTQPPFALALLSNVTQPVRTSLGLLQCYRELELM